MINKVTSTSSRPAPLNFFRTGLIAYARRGADEARIVDCLDEWLGDVTRPLKLQWESMGAFAALPAEVRLGLDDLVRSVELPSGLARVPEAVATLPKLEEITFAAFDGERLELERLSCMTTLKTVRVSDAPALRLVTVPPNVDVLGRGELSKEKIEVRHIDASGHMSGTSSVIGQVYFAARREAEVPGIDFSRLNCTVRFETGDVIACRHLAMKEILTQAMKEGHLADARAEEIGTPERMTRRIGSDTDEVVAGLYRSSTDIAIVHHDDWGVFLDDCLRYMPLDEMRFAIVDAPRHWMLLSLKNERLPSGRVVGVVKFYDPNWTLTHLRAVVETGSLADLTISTFLARAFLPSYYEVTNPGHVESAGSVLDEATTGELSMFLWVPQQWIGQGRMDLKMEPRSHLEFREYLGPASVGEHCPSRTAFAACAGTGLDHLDELLRGGTREQASRQLLTFPIAWPLVLNNADLRGIGLLKEVTDRAAQLGVGREELVRSLRLAEEESPVSAAHEQAALDAYIEALSFLQRRGHLREEDVRSLLSDRPGGGFVLEHFMSENRDIQVTRYLVAVRRALERGLIDSSQLVSLVLGSEPSSKINALREGLKANALDAIDAWCSGIVDLAKRGVLERTQVQRAFGLKFADGSRVASARERAEWPAEAIQRCELGWVRAMEVFESSREQVATAVEIDSVTVDLASPSAEPLGTATSSEADAVTTLTHDLPLSARPEESRAGPSVQPSPVKRVAPPPDEAVPDYVDSVSFPFDKSTSTWQVHVHFRVAFKAYGEGRIKKAELLEALRLRSDAGALTGLTYAEYFERPDLIVACLDGVHTALLRRAITAQEAADLLKSMPAGARELSAARNYRDAVTIMQRLCGLARQQRTSSEAVRSLVAHDNDAFIAAVREALESGGVLALDDIARRLPRAPLNPMQARDLSRGLKQLLRKRILFWHIPTPLARAMRKSQPAALHACEGVLRELMHMRSAGQTLPLPPRAQSRSTVWAWIRR